MSNEIVPSIGFLVANEYAILNTMEEFRSRKSENTLRAQDADIATFNEFLKAAGDHMILTWQIPQSFRGLTWGLVKAFVAWMLQQGWAVTTVNRKLSTVKAYAQLANQMGTLTTDEAMKIKAVRGYAQKEVKRVDEKRGANRKSTKKKTNTKISFEQACALKCQPDTHQGIRDALLMALLLDMGFRAEEAANLTVASCDMDNRQITLYREKVQKQQTHNMSTDVYRLLVYWLEIINDGMLLRATNKSGAIQPGGITSKTISTRVMIMGLRIGLYGLSAHDCRHYWATRAIDRGTDPFALMNAGGWNSMVTVERYVDKSMIANRGVKI